MNDHDIFEAAFRRNSSKRKSQLLPYFVAHRDFQPEYREPSSSPEQPEPFHITVSNKRQRTRSSPNIGRKVSRGARRRHGNSGLATSKDFRKQESLPVDASRSNREKSTTPPSARFKTGDDSIYKRGNYTLRYTIARRRISKGESVYSSRTPGLAAGRTKR
ncbi:hypothetical protein DTO280E4_8341 [Paecilomyces variotii]|nr:hypothetical protein DTO169E5_5331 [Paecilomyces variotii]KAJ9261101.1 hypothetical protein DTO207G8_251 [Paecilomyces variotii]KAJ9305578.1 hypothetical protein DTO217A2_4977 [Paecilomyces variotii]KAJ9351195.1 hypothetical protein DTO280E4_8341 [Paecilomyces variotii]KAJ9370756.1 hypothetical protein DTO282E5_4516 [Paecilomyces variotii]